MSAAEPVAVARRAGPFTLTAVLAMLGVGVFAFAAFLVLSAYAPDLKSGDDGQAHALSKSAVGYAGAVRLMQALDVPVVVSRGHRASAGADDAGVMVLTPLVSTDPEALKKVHFDGVTLVVLPKWQAMPDQLHRGWVRKFGLHEPEETTAPLGKAAGALSRRPNLFAPTLAGTGEMFARDTRIPLPPIDQLQTFSGADWKALLVDDQGGMVLGYSDKAGLYLLTDPDLLNTQGLKDIRSARAASVILNALRAPDGPVVFDVTLAGYERGRNILKLAFEPPFLALTLCLLAAAALMGWHAATRFGAPLHAARAIALGKRALADNSAALIRLVKREHRLAPGYAALTRKAVAAALGAPKDLTDDDLDAFLDRIGQARGVEDRMAALAAAAREATDAATLLDVARRLHRWKLEMTRERR